MNVIHIKFETHDRAAEVNEKLLIALGCIGGTLIYHTNTRVEYQHEDPIMAIEWMISGEVIDPTVDDYTIRLGVVEPQVR